jgi:hypothetical protein
MVFFHSNVSHPGGPRKHKIQRQPQFPDLPTTIDVAEEPWRFMVASESHKETTRQFQAYPEHYLSGESIGRQIWTTSDAETNASNNAVDESLIQELAAGGRRFNTFNPAENPNR